MTSVYAEIELVRSADVLLAQDGLIDSEKIHRCTVRALVNQNVTMLAIPELVRSQLDLCKTREVEADLADGSTITLDVVEPVEVRFYNRRTLVEAIVLPDSAMVLLGLIPITGLDVVIDSESEQLIVNPKSRDRARMLLK